MTNCRILALLALVVGLGWTSTAEAASLSKVLQIPSTATDEEATEVVRLATDDILSSVLSELDAIRGTSGGASATGGSVGSPSYGHCGQPINTGCSRPTGNNLSCGGGGGSGGGGFGIVINIDITIEITIVGNWGGGGGGHASPCCCYGF